MRSVSRISARLLLSVAAAMLATTRMASPAIAGADRGPAVNRAYQHLLRMEGAREARMAAREHPGQALPIGILPTAPSILSQPQDVQQIAEDTLKGGEQGTQVEPDMAIDPNNPDSLVAVVQQGRFKTGGSADPGA